MKNYKQALAAALGKLHEPQAITVGVAECTKIFHEWDAYQSMISVLLEQSSSNKLQTVREQIKIFGLLAATIKHEIYPYTLQIMNFMIKKLRDFDENSSVVNNVAETIGRIVQHVIIKEFSSFHNLMLKPLFLHLQQSPQHSLCLTRIVQFLPVDMLQENAVFLLRKFITLLNGQNGKVEILEGMAAIILSVEDQAVDFADDVLPVLGPLLINSAWQIKKMALDVLYSLAVLSGEKVRLNSSFRDITMKLKSDKVCINLTEIKQVRDSATLVFDLLNNEQSDQNNDKSDRLERLDRNDKQIERPGERLFERPAPPSEKIVTSHRHQSTAEFSHRAPGQNMRIANRNNSSLSSRGLINNPEKPAQISTRSRYLEKSVNPTEQKLELAIEAICMLSSLLINKGVLEEGELAQVNQIVKKLKPQCDQGQIIAPEPLQHRNNTFYYGTQTNTPLAMNSTSRSFEYNQSNLKNWSSNTDLTIDDRNDQETFISKEAAQILKEFKERQLRQ